MAEIRQSTTRCCCVRHTTPCCMTVSFVSARTMASSYLRMRTADQYRHRARQWLMRRALRPALPQWHPRRLRRPTTLYGMETSLTTTPRSRPCTPWMRRSERPDDAPRATSACALVSTSPSGAPMSRSSPNRLRGVAAAAALSWQRSQAPVFAGVLPGSPTVCRTPDPPELATTPTVRGRIATSPTPVDRHHPPPSSAR